MNAFVILLGAAFISSMMPALAEIALSNFSIGLQDSSLSTDNSTFDYDELNNSSAINESVKAAMLKLPLSFIENRGQSPEDVKFMVKTSGQTVFFTPSEILFALSGNTSSVVHMAFEGSKAGQITGEQQLSGTANFFIGNDSSKWINEIPTFGSIRYKDLYPEVDLVFKGTEGHLKHELILNLGADPSQIILAYRGQDNLSLIEDGSVLIRTAAGNLTDSAPICYQEINGSRMKIDAWYRLIKGQKIGFEIGSYDRRYPLVIDPALAFSTYLGGSDNEYRRGDDYGYDIAVDSGGNTYICGYTESQDFPTQNPIQASNADYFDDVFIAKINADGSALVYSTYLGGLGDDTAYGIAVDNGGNAYISGETVSQNFPTKNPIQAYNAGLQDGFVTKINAAGSALVYSTYLGGSVTDQRNRIAIDSFGNAYVTGYTYSIDFPTKNPIQASLAGSLAGYPDAFVAKINEAGSALVYSTYLGGGGKDYGYDIAVDSSGNAYICGETNSINFTIQNPIQASLAGSYDVFITKINEAGSALVYSTYLGGSSSDYGRGIAVDNSNNAYITGFTLSANFPTKNPIQASLAGSTDVFVTKINEAGSALVYSTYLGGSSGELGLCIAVDDDDNAFVSGYTDSTNFPTKNPIQASLADLYDAFVAEINASGSLLANSTYIGGNRFDYCFGIAVNGSGNVHISGYTDSTDFPIKNPIQTSLAGYGDAFIASISSTDINSLNIKKYTNGEDADAAPGPYIPSCEGAVTWQYDVTTDADVPIHNLTVTDSMPGIIPVYVSGDTNGDGQLTSDETWIYQATGNAIEGQYANIGTVTGSTPSDHFVTDSDASYYFGIECQYIEQWNMTFGGAADDSIASVQQTSDGGFIIAGQSCSYGNAANNVWLLKTDSVGNELWNNTFSNGASQSGDSVQQAIDGEYIIAGMIQHLDNNAWLIKANSTGTKLWDKEFGGSSGDDFKSVQLTSDGGYVVTGSTYNYDAGGHNAWLIETDSNGQSTGSHVFRGPQSDSGNSVQQTSDGGYIIAGETSSYGAGLNDAWLIKTDTNCNEVWNGTFGGSNQDYGRSIQQTSDGGYLIAGETSSYGAGSVDAWLIKTDSAGNELWNETYGGASADYGRSVLETSDGGYLIAGYTYSFGVGNSDAWLVRTDSDGNELWNETIGGLSDDRGVSMQQTSDGGYIISGYTKSYGAGGNDAWLIKVKPESGSFPCISGYKLNGDTNEGLDGWEITLKNSSYTASKITDSTGYYEFCGLAPGFYTISETLKSGWTAATSPALDVALGDDDLINLNFTNLGDASIDLSLYVDDALAPKDMPIMVNKAPGDKADVVVVVTNGGDSPQTVDIELNPIPSELGLPEKGIIRRSFIPLSQIGEIEPGITTVQLKDLGPGETRQIVWRFSISNSAVPKSVLIGAKVKINGITSLESSTGISIIDHVDAIIVTNRHLLYKNYYYFEVNSILNYIYKFANQDNKNCLIYYVDHYDEDLEKWDQKISDADYDAGESQVNKVAVKVDGLINTWAKKTKSDYLVILGGDEIIPYYRVKDTATEINNPYNSEDPVKHAMDKGYFVSDSLYSDTDGIDLTKGKVELKTGRIIGYSAEDIEKFLENSRKGPNGDISVVASLTDSKNKEWDADWAISELKKKMTIIDESVLNDNDKWNKDVLISALQKGFTIFAYFSHGGYNEYQTPGPDLQSNEISQINSNNCIKDNRPFIANDGCRLGIVSGDDEWSTSDEWDDCIMYALVHNGISGAFGAGGIMYWWPSQDIVQYGESFGNDFFKELQFDGEGRTVAVGDAFNNAKLKYSPKSANFDGIDKKTMMEYMLYGLPWMTIPISSPSKATGESTNEQRAIRTQSTSQLSINVSMPIAGIDGNYSRTIEANVTGYSVLEMDEFSLITIEGAEEKGGLLKPSIPTAVVSIFLPPNTSISALQLENSSSAYLGTFNIPSTNTIPDVMGAIGYSNESDVVGYYPSPTYSMDVSSFEGYELVRVFIALIQHDPQTKETILYNHTMLNITYSTPTNLIIGNTSTDKPKYANGEPINFSSSITNVGPATLNGLLMNLYLKDIYGQVKSHKSSLVFDIAPQESKTVSLEMAQSLPDGFYSLEMNITNSTEISLGNCMESVVISTGSITNFSSSDNVLMGDNISFNIAFNNNNSTSIQATGLVSIFDPNSIELATIESLPVIIAPDSQGQMEMNWSIANQKAGAYRAAAYVSANGEYFGPEYIDFTILKCISGTKFNDTNSNATRDPGEAGLSGWTIRLTKPDGTSINATTDANGAYKFENLTSGTYRVSEVRQSNWTQTYPAWLGDHIINVTDGDVTGIDFGNNYLPVPEIPFPPSGPASGIPGAEYSYSTSSTDPSGYQIVYTFDWGDGSNSTTGLFDSGAVASAAHIWNGSGVYQVRAMATNSKGASSGWSDPLVISITNPIFGWKALGGVITSSPSAIMDNQDKTEVWVRGGDDALWLNIDGSWQGKGGYLTSDPFAAEDYNGRIHVLARGGDNGAWDFIYDPVTQSGEWVGLGGYITEGLTAARDPANHNLMRVAARGGDEALWTCDLDINARSSSWSFQGGVLTSRPYIIFDPSGKEHILVRGGDNALWDRNGEWTGSSYTRTWSTLGGILANSPVATIEPGADSRIAVFAQGGDDAIWMCDVDSSSQTETGSWHRLGGIISSDIFAVADSSGGKIHSFARGSDMALWENAFATSPWNPDGGQWLCHGGLILDYRPGATLTDVTQAFVIGTDNGLWQNTQATASATAGDAKSVEREAEKKIQSSITDQDLREMSPPK